MEADSRSLRLKLIESQVMFQEAMSQARELLMLTLEAAEDSDDEDYLDDDAAAEYDDVIQADTKLSDYVLEEVAVDHIIDTSSSVLHDSAQEWSDDEDSPITQDTSTLKKPEPIRSITPTVSVPPPANTAAVMASSAFRQPASHTIAAAANKETPSSPIQAQSPPTTSSISSQSLDEVMRVLEQVAKEASAGQEGISKATSSEVTGPLRVAAAMSVRSTSPMSTIRHPSPSNLFRSPSQTPPPRQSSGTLGGQTSPPAPNRGNSRAAALIARSNSGADTARMRVRPKPVARRARSYDWANSNDDNDSSNGAEVPATETPSPPSPRVAYDWTIPTDPPSSQSASTSRSDPKRYDWNNDNTREESDSRPSPQSSFGGTGVHGNGTDKASGSAQQPYSNRNWKDARSGSNTPRLYDWSVSTENEPSLEQRRSPVRNSRWLRSRSSDDANSDDSKQAVPSANEPSDSNKPETSRKDVADVEEKSENWSWPSSQPQKSFWDTDTDPDDDIESRWGRPPSKPFF